MKVDEILAREAKETKNSQGRVIPIQDWYVELGSEREQLVVVFYDHVYSTTLNSDHERTFRTCHMVVYQREDRVHSVTLSIKEEK